MSDIDVPAGQAGGHRLVPVTAELPEKLRVHALAKLISVTSRRVLDTLAELGAPARGAQSSVDRETALRVIDSLNVDEPSQVLPEPAADVSAALFASADECLAHSEDPAASADSADEAGDADEADVAHEEVGAQSLGSPLPLFAVPSPMFLPPAPIPVARPVAKPRPAVVDLDEDSDEPGAGLFDQDGAADGIDDGSETRRRRRRGRRGRGRGLDDEGAAAETDESFDAADDELGDSSCEPEQDADDEEVTDAAETEPGSTTRRRRRRRRRRGSSDGDAGDVGDADDVADVSDTSDVGEDNDDSAAHDDPPNTITKIREPRAIRPDNGDEGIQGVRGSTRLEAKRQRRRDGRDAGRRRAPVLSEAEFLARREAVERTMVVRQHGARSEIGVLEDGVLVEHFVTSLGGSSLVGNVYLGRVQNVLPSMEAAFVDIGRGRNAVLYAGEVDWDAAGLAGKARRIEQALSSGDSILVQVTKDPVGHKGARLTTQISLPGRFLVYVPAGGTHGISRKLPDTERRRLKDLLKSIVPEDAGVIIRTASEGVSQEALERDVRRLQAQWAVVSAKAEAARNNRSKTAELLYEEPDLMIKVVRDQFNEDFSELVVAGDDAWDTLQSYVSYVAPELADRLHRHVGTNDVFSEYRIDEQLLKALDRKVWLPSGGTLVIDRTEAMTVIDVNTGKFTGSGGNLEETVTRNNLEAAEEIVRQLRLRDIGGIIVIDFIDMVLESNRDLVLRRLTECLGRDRTRHQVAEVTSLGLVQMTRKRVGVGLLEAFSIPCEHCRGRGVLVSADPIEPKTDYASPGSPAGARRRGRGDEGHDSRRRIGNGVGRDELNNGREHQLNGYIDQTNGQEPSSPMSAVPHGELVPELPAGASSAGDGIGSAPIGQTAADSDIASPQVSSTLCVEVTSAASAELPRQTGLPAAPERFTLFKPAMVESAEEPSESKPDPFPPDSGRPARRRRRVASRPAGPPASGDPV